MNDVGPRESRPSGCDRRRVRIDAEQRVLVPAEQVASDGQQCAVTARGIEDAMRASPAFSGGERLGDERTSDGLGRVPGAESAAVRGGQVRIDWTQGTRLPRGPIRSRR